jgi:hypothetical protein
MRPLDIPEILILVLLAAWIALALWQRHHRV